MMVDLLMALRYGQTSSRRVDLVGDYAGKELFLLEGDSLLLHCFNDPRLDFGGKYPLIGGIQFGS